VNEVDKPMIVKGFIKVPDTPGLGVTLNDDVMRQSDPGSTHRGIRPAGWFATRFFSYPPGQAHRL